MTISSDTRKELLNYAVNLLNDYIYDTVMTEFRMLDEENRYYNWYHGYTKVELPKYINDEGTNQFQLKTTAASGYVSIQNLEQAFDAKTGSIEVDITLLLPKKDASNSDNIQLHLEIDRKRLMDGNESFAIVKQFKHLYSQVRTPISPGM